MIATSLVALLGQAEIRFNEVMASNGGKCPNAASDVTNVIRKNVDASKLRDVLVV